MILCSAPTREFLSRDSTQLWQKKFFIQNLFKRFIWEGESRRVVPSPGVEKGSSKLNRHNTYMGLLRSEFFQGDFSA